MRFKLLSSSLQYCPYAVGGLRLLSTASPYVTWSARALLVSQHAAAGVWLVVAVAFAVWEGLCVQVASLKRPSLVGALWRSQTQLRLLFAL